VTEVGRFEQIAAETPYPGIARRVLGTAKATVQEYRFDPGATYPLHEHPQEQITMVLEGELTFTVGAEVHALSGGAWSVVPGDVPHGITAGPTGARFLAILIPPRKDPQP
jgi:quercetin dioxygenase-like cupin family protein